MYTYKEACIFLDYYTAEMLGKSIGRSKSLSLPITDIKIEQSENNKFDVICYAKSESGIGFFRDIRSAAKELDLFSPS